jgi:hypothetical protein
VKITSYTITTERAAGSIGMDGLIGMGMEKKLANPFMLAIKYEV